MKRLIYFIVLISTASFGQTQPPTQTFNGVLYQYKNSLRVDSNFFLPKRDTSGFNSALTALGNLRMRPADSIIYYWKGTKWLSLLSSLDTTSLSTRINAKADTLRLNDSLAVLNDRFIRNSTVYSDGDFRINGKGAASQLEAPWVIQGPFRHEGTFAGYVLRNTSSTNVPMFIHMDDDVEFTGHVSVAAATADEHAVRLGQLNDSLNAQDLQRTMNRGNTTTVPLIGNRITSQDFIPSNIAFGAIDISRDINDGGTLNARGFRDNTIFRRGKSTTVIPVPGEDYYSYASYDAVGELNGQNFDHIVGFQSRPILNISGEANNLYSFFSRPTITSGIADSTFGMYLGNPTGNVNNYYALYIDGVTAGTTSNYSIYSTGGRNYFNGDVGIGTGSLAPSEKLDVYGNANIRGGRLNLLNGTSNFLFLSNVGAGAPATGSRSIGTKIVYYSTNLSSQVEFAAGVGSGHLWNSVPTSSEYFAWYANTSMIARIDGVGRIIAGSSSAPTSTLQSSGSLATAAPFSTVSSITLTGSHYAVIVTNSSHNITLPTASTCTGRIYIIVNYNTGGNVTISSVNRNGAATTTLPDNAKWTIQSDGTSWYVIQD